MNVMHLTAMNGDVARAKRANAHDRNVGLRGATRARVDVRVCLIQLISAVSRSTRPLDSRTAIALVRGRITFAICLQCTVQVAVPRRTSARASRAPSIRIERESMIDLAANSPASTARRGNGARPMPQRAGWLDRPEGPSGKRFALVHQGDRRREGPRTKSRTSASSAGGDRSPA